MLNAPGLVLPDAREALAVALDVGVKATVLLVIALAAHAAVGRRRALVRSALWNACLVGLLVLPVASLAFPRLRLVVLPTQEVAASAAPLSPSRIVPLPPPVSPEEVFAVVPPSFTFSPAVPSGAFQVAHPPPSQQQARQPVDVTDSTKRGWSFDLAARLVVGSYLLVAMLLVLRLAASLTAVGRLRQRCEAVDHSSWIVALQHCQARLGMARRVWLLKSDQVSVPVVVGSLRPAIILPRSLAATASRPELVDAVLLHELSHIQRGDFGWNLVRRLTQALYWPHPLVWPLGRITSAVREQACDDLCVHALGGPSAYHASLVEVASGLVTRRRPEPSLGLAMAKRTTALGRRLSWIDRSRGTSHCLLRWPARLALATAILSLASVLGSIELARATANPTQEPTTTKASKAQEPDQPPKPPEQAPVKGPESVQVTVLAKDTGKPLAGARIRAYLGYQFDHLTTDEQGTVRIDRANRRVADFLSLDAWTGGYVQQRHLFSQVDPGGDPIPADLTIELLPGEQTLGGQVVDEQGQPIAGVKVEVWGYLGEKKDPHELAYMVDATTNDQGQWRCRSFRDMTFAYLYLSHPDFIDDGDSHPRRHGSPQPGVHPQPDEQPLQALRDFTDIEVMTRGIEITGRVVDQQDQPIAGAEVGWIEESQRDTFHNDMPTTTTDADGRFVFPHVRPGLLILQVMARGHAPELKPVQAKEGMDPVALKLDPPRTLPGRLVDTSGRPIPDATIVIDTWRGYRALGVFLKTDAEGRFRWDEAPADSVLMNVNHRGYETVFRHRASPEGGEILLTLKRSLSITGSVRDAETGKKVMERARVEVGVPDPETGQISWKDGSELTFSGGIIRATCSDGRLGVNLDAEKERKYQFRIKARGYATFESRVFQSSEGQVLYDIELTKTDEPQGPVISGVVKRPDGTPLQGAQVTVTYPLSGRTPLPVVSIENGTIRPKEDQPIVETDAEGRFCLTREPDPDGQYFALVVVHPDFYAEVNRAAFEADPTITARPWGRVEGVARLGGQPAGGAEIKYRGDRLGNLDVPYVIDSGSTTADAQGRFVLDRVVPGDVRVSRGYGEGQNQTAWSNGTLIEVKPGETARVQVGGRGRPVVARIARPEGFDPEADYTLYSQFQIESDRPGIPYPKEVRARRDESMMNWGKQWWTSAEGREYRRDWFRLGQARIGPDGTIRADDVPPGDYKLTLTYTARPPYGRSSVPEQVAHATRQFTVPEISGGHSDEPLDLGTLRPGPKQTLDVGQQVPAFEVETLDDDGNKLSLADFRGKYLLIDFWATWCGPCIEEIPELQAVHDRFGKDERFAMLSLSLDADKEAPRKFVAKNGLPWRQGFVGDWVEGGVQESFHVAAIPAIFLIGPDGKLVAKDLRSSSISSAVARALESP